MATKGIFGDKSMIVAFSVLSMTTLISFGHHVKATAIITRERERRMIGVRKEERRLEKKLGIPISLMESFDSYEDMEARVLEE